MSGATCGVAQSRLVGTASKRAAIGAKVRVQAAIWGESFWQLREISGGGGVGSQNDLRAHFGLGNATNVTSLRIEWPSGIVQELSNVAASQILTITEPVQLVPLGPREFQFCLGGWSLTLALFGPEMLPVETVSGKAREILIPGDPLTSVFDGKRCMLCIGHLLDIDVWHLHLPSSRKSAISPGEEFRFTPEP